MLKITDFIRWILFIALMYGIYTETGPWTVVFATLITLNFEIREFLSRLARKAYENS